MSSLASTSQANDLGTVVRGFTAGGLAAVVSKTTTAPIERVKLVLQLQNRSALAGTSQQNYSGMMHCFKSLCAEQGFMSLWRGNLANVAKCFPSHALNFVLRDQYRLLFLRNVDRKRQYGRFVLGSIAAGGAGGVTSLCVIYPLDLARTRLAVETNKNGNSKYRGIYDCLRTIRHQEGFAGTYRGFMVSLQFVALSRAVFFGMFDVIRATVADDTRNLHFFTVWTIAQACIISSGLICYPLDTVRRKLMVQSNQQTYNGSVDCCVKMFRKGGLPIFYHGALTNSVKSTSGALLVALYYEIIKYM